MAGLQDGIEDLIVLLGRRVAGAALEDGQPEGSGVLEHVRVDDVRQDEAVWVLPVGANHGADELHALRAVLERVARRQQVDGNLAALRACDLIEARQHRLGADIGIQLC